MQELTKQNIRLIAETIDRAEITFSHLREDLIDHVCCEIEAELERGLDFSKAFEKIKTNFGIKNLQNVQEKTLLLIDKNYCTMKKTMKVSGIISVFLLMFGSLFKIQHWPAAGIMLTLGFFILCFLFLPSANYVMHKERKDRSLILLYLSAFLGSFGFFLGILFKVQHWPGANVMLAGGIAFLCLLFFPFLLRFLLKKAASTKEKLIYSIGIVSAIIYLTGLLFKFQHWPGAVILLNMGALLIVVLFLPLFTRFKYAQSKRIESSFIYLIAAITWFLLFSMLISLTISRNILNEFVINENTNKTITNYIMQKNESNYALNNLNNTDSSLTTIKALTSGMYVYIQDIKTEILKNLNDQSYLAIQNRNQIDTRKIEDKANTNVPFKILIGDDLNGEAFNLHKKIDELKASLFLLVNNDEVTCQFIAACLNTEIPKDAPEWIKSWEMLYFNHSTVVDCFAVLTCLQRNVKIAEYEAINFIINQ